MSNVPDRYVDSYRAIGDFAQRSLVVCPRCGRCATANAEGGWFSGDVFYARSARVTCPNCAFTETAQNVGYASGAADWLGPSVGYALYSRCPQCGGQLGGALRSAPAGGPRPKSARVTCPVGGHEVEVELAWEPARSAEPLDPMFGLPLWLQEPCCGETLWAFNGEHVAELRAYVSADLRERAFNSQRSMAARLPKWMTAAKNRSAVLRCLDRLTDRLLGHD